MTHVPTLSHAGFLQDCLPALAEKSMLTLAILEVDGDAVAAQAVLEGAASAAEEGRLPKYWSGLPVGGSS